MTFWIYNVGMGVPIAEKRIYLLNKSMPLEELSKTARIHGTQEEKQSPREQTQPSQENTQRQQLSQTVDSDKSEKAKKRPTKNPYLKNTDVKEIFLAEHLMTSPVISLNFRMTLKEAWNSFTQYRYRHFTVVDNSNKLVGIVADRDILNLVSKNNFSLQPNQMNLPINQLMRHHVLTAEPKTLIKEICQVMFLQHVGAIPITTKQGGIIGIITRSDILRSMIKNKPLELWL